MPTVPAPRVFLFRAGPDLGGHRAVQLVNGVVVLCNAKFDADKWAFTGMTTKAARGGDWVPVIVDGLITEPSWLWEPGKPVYVGENGVLTQTPPVAPQYAFQLAVGHADAPTRVWIRRHVPITLVA